MWTKNIEQFRNEKQFNGYDRTSRLITMVRCMTLTFSYSVSETVERHDIDGMRPPPSVCASLATDNTPDEPCTVAYWRLNNTFITQKKQKLNLMHH